jgi:hypothetical protein
MNFKTFIFSILKNKNALILLTVTSQDFTPTELGF